MQVGHTTRSCTILKAEADPSVVNADDLAFWELVVPEARPSSLVRGYDQESDSDDDESDLESEREMDIE